MITNQVMFQANLVRVDELATSSSGNSFLRLSVAKNYRTKEGDVWTDLPPIYVNLVLFGRDAEAFAQSEIPLGTPLLIVGELRGRYSTYQRNGVEEGMIEEVVVKAIAPIISLGRSVTVKVNKKDGSSPTPKKATTTTNKKAPKKQNDDNLFASSDDDSLVDSDDLFPTSNSGEFDDDIDDIFS